MNTADKPEKFGYHYDWVKVALRPYNGNLSGFDVDDIESTMGLVGLRNSELRDLGFTDNQIDDIKDTLDDSDAWEELSKQNNTVTASDVLDRIEEGGKSACDRGGCFKLSYDNGAFPDWGDAKESAKDFVKDILEDYAGDFFDEIKDAAECPLLGKNCDDDDEPTFVSDCPNQ